MKTYLGLLSMLLLAMSCTTQEAEQEKDEHIERVNANVPENATKDAFFGDLHLHTGWSFDAFIYNVRSSPDDAYTFAKGGSMKHVDGREIKLNRPLDFLAVSDHAEYMGVMKEMINPDSEMFGLEIANRIRSKEVSESVKAFGEVGLTLAYSQPMEELHRKEFRINTWKKAVAAADKHNQPGTFTAFPAYEWTSSPVTNGSGGGAFNLHRNVIYRGDKVSELPYSSFDSQNPEDLWNWMEGERKKGIDVFAIPHNGNMSDGLMYMTQTLDSQVFNLEYVQKRIENEPINEVVQIKGQSMSHPDLFPNDEFADYELYPNGFPSGDFTPVSRPNGSYVRQAFQKGLELEEALGVNPYQFGIIGSSDGHIGASPVEEDNYFGKLGALDKDAQTRIGESARSLRVRQFSAAGLAGIWARSNTRDALYESMINKEVFATSGTRLKVRFFASDKYDKDLMSQANWLETAYKDGSPMGTVISKSLTTSPVFLIQAVKDAEGANLDRVQVIKTYLDDKGVGQEKIYEVLWSGDRKLDSNGKLAAVGSTVDQEKSTYENSIGSVALEGSWVDPDFKANQKASYFVRVLEIPTPRWNTYDAAELGIENPKELDKEIQERAWSSPIWFSPEK